MAHKIIWSNRAISRLKNIAEYLRNNWSTKVNDDFFQTFRNKLEILARFPKIGIKFTNRDYRKLLITEHFYLHYRIEENRIILLTIKDTRQRP
jgi:plasmid stabilization system protein ParE